MKKILKSFTFWFILIALFEIYMHQVGRDSKSIVLISLNPILSMISHSDKGLIFMNSGMKISCGTITGSISVYWYIASVVTWLVYGVVFDAIKLIVLKLLK